MSTNNKSQMVKCTIVNTENNSNKVEAKYNPKEVGIKRSVNWQSHDSGGDIPNAEFGSASARDLSVELFFDTYEEKKDVFETCVKQLMLMTQVPKDASADKKHPPKVILEWGKFPKFVGVIKNLDIKYTMFLPDGTPVRATCNVSMQEAEKTQIKKSS